ncbi:hypothetical protein [Synechocystis sp. LKSZ1]|uniref:DUF6930 domain-containing protein n=1 Tax=Synechocystis sp. LKSZ1 TaxID=3144951 RepID=UPI00336BCA84
MTSLPSNTQHRLQKLPQIPSVWEGDRRTLQGGEYSIDGDSPAAGDCILWVDGSEGMVRAMDIVASDIGPEAIVRTLIRAMETPRRPAVPARPQKIVVRNREIQFFLRGALQSLGIAIDYVPELPLIDELFRSFEAPEDNRPDPLPKAYSKPLKQLADQLWKVAPWQYLTDHEIITIHWDAAEASREIYGCVLGMLGQEYGIILYRSLDSLKQFRVMAASVKDPEQMEQAFLSQDCWFLNYEAHNFDPEDTFDIGELSVDEVVPLFGSVHPLEGVRPFLDEEEAEVVYYALEGIRQFVRQHHKHLSQDPIEALEQKLAIAPPSTTSTAGPTVQLSLAIQPPLIEELLAIEDEADETAQSPLRNDLVPANACLSLGMIPWPVREALHDNPRAYCQKQTVETQGDGFPVLIIQTSRPKAQEMINRLQEEGGIIGLGFNLGEDSWTATSYDLGILQTGAKNLYLFGEFLQDSPTHHKARQKWNQRCQSTKGYCGLLIAMGVSGRSRGNPQLKDMLGFFEARFLSAEELGIGPLQLMPHFDMEW